MNFLSQFRKVQQETARPTSHRVGFWLRAMALGVAVSMSLQGCAIYEIQKSNKAVEKNGDQAMDYIQQLRDRKPLPDSRDVMHEMSHIWVDTTPQPLTNKSLGAAPTALDCNVTFNPKSPVTLEEFARVVGNLCGMTIDVTADATAMLNGSLRVAGSRGGNGRSPGATGAASSRGNMIGAEGLPSPALAAMGPGGAANAAAANAAADSNSVLAEGYVGNYGITDSISGVNWVNKPLSGLMDLVTSRLGLGWKFKDNVATVYYMDTQVFHLYAIPGQVTMSTTVKTGAEKSASTSGSQDNSIFSADGSSQETGVKFQTDIVKDIQKTLEAMITPGLGRISVSPSTGTVTVTDRPDVLTRVKDFLDDENKRITRQVVLNVRVLSVQLTNNDNIGLNWNAVLKTAASKISWATSMAQVSGGGSGNIGIINNNSKFDGTQALIDALSTQGRVSTLSSPSVTTLNLKPAPILIGRQTTYLAQVSTTALAGGTAGGTSQQSLVPGTITTGFNMTLLPYLMDGPEMLLQYSVNLSALNAMNTATSGGNMIQMPDLDNRIFSQSVRLRSGETLVISGFDQAINNANKNGMGDPNFWLLGGGGNRQDSRDILVVLITPIVTD